MNRANRRRENRTDRQSTTPTVGDMSHTHPCSDNGAVNRPFQRGPIVAADGGEREAYEQAEADAPEEPEAETDVREEDDERERDRMKDVTHTPPHGEGANSVFERGGKEEPVESEE